jgi:hypothetical protein
VQIIKGVRRIGCKRITYHVGVILTGTFPAAAGVARRRAISSFSCVICSCAVASLVRPIEWKKAKKELLVAGTIRKRGDDRYLAFSCCAIANQFVSEVLSRGAAAR